mgnify:CR=1 FL=1
MNVAGVDSSTQSTKVLIKNAQTGELIREGSASHQSGVDKNGNPIFGTETDPQIWLQALHLAIKNAGGLEDVAAISIAGQQHGMVLIDENKDVVRPALLWNDVRSASQAKKLNFEIGGDNEIAKRTGSVLLAAFTASKVRWVAENESENIRKTHAIALPHDWLSWKINANDNSLESLATDASDASGTGYFNPLTNSYDYDLLNLSVNKIKDAKEITLPKITPKNQPIGISNLVTGKEVLIAPGAGDNAGAALGLNLQPGDAVISLGTSGTVFVVSDKPTNDSRGLVAGFSDTTGRYLPLVCTLNAARIFDQACKLLDVNFAELSDLALKALPGSGGLTLLPYFEGERTPNRPNAKGILSGMNLSNSTRENIARAMIEGVICGMVDAVLALKECGIQPKRYLLIGGAASNPAVQQITASLLGGEIYLPTPGQYVAEGAARQAAWILNSTPEPPIWNNTPVAVVNSDISTKVASEVIERYRELRDSTESWN